MLPPEVSDINSDREAWPPTQVECPNPWRRCGYNVATGVGDSQAFRSRRASPMTQLQIRSLASPQPGASRKAEFKQALRLPQTLLAIYRIVCEEFAVGRLDEYLWAFWGFHQEPWDQHWRMRPWDKVQLRDIGPRDVTAIEIREMAAMLSIAMEDEEPIPEYTRQSGEGFRYLLPTLGRYMGKTQEQAAFGAEHDLSWCEGPWCAEERRHGNTLARIVERLTEHAPVRDNPNRPMVVTADDGSAIRHLVSRQTTEWNASSSYVVLAAHAKGQLHPLLRNLARDEIKHLCIMSAAYKYLFGPRPWRRFLELVKKGLENYRSQQKSRSAGRALGANPITAVEGIAGHLLVEFFLRRWLRTVPLRTLETVFETLSRATPLAEPSTPEQRRVEVDLVLREARGHRLGLLRWEPVARKKALEQRQFEGVSAALLERKIRDELDGFDGAEIPGSREARKMIARLRRSGRSGSPLLRAALRDYFRDFQIRHNPHVAARCS